MDAFVKRGRQSQRPQGLASGSRPIPTMSCATGRASQRDLPPFLPVAMTGRDERRAYHGSIAFRVPRAPAPTTSARSSRTCRSTCSPSPKCAPMHGRRGQGPPRPDRRRPARCRPVRTTPLTARRRGETDRPGSRSMPPCSPRCSTAACPAGSAIGALWVLAHLRRAGRRLHVDGRRPPVGAQRC